MKPGDEHWTKVNCGHRIRGPILSFQGRVYCVENKYIMVVETTSPDHPVKAAMLEEPLQCKRSRVPTSHNVMDTLHLVDNGEELMMVHRIPELIHYRLHIFSLSCKVYRVDLNTATMTRVSSNFGGRAMFIGMRRTLSVPAGLSSFITSDSVCVGFDCDGTLGSNHDSGKELVHPHTIAECLCRYIGGHKTE